MNLSDLPLTLTVDEFAEEVARCDRKVIYRAIEAGDIRACRIGRHIRIPREAVAEWLGVNPPAEDVDIPGLRVIEGGS